MVASTKTKLNNRQTAENRDEGFRMLIILGGTVFSWVSFAFSIVDAAGDDRMIEEHKIIQ